MWRPDFGTLMVENSIEEVRLLVFDSWMLWKRHAKFCEAQIGLNAFLLGATDGEILDSSILTGSIATLEIPGSAWKHRERVAEKLKTDGGLWLRPIPPRLYFDRHHLKVIPVELCGDSLELISSTPADSLAIEKAALKRNRRAKNISEGFSKTAT